MGRAEDQQREMRATEEIEQSHLFVATSTDANAQGLRVQRSGAMAEDQVLTGGNP